MIINLIVGFTLLLVSGFAYMWCTSPTLRKKIEQPKYQFQDQASAFDRQAHADDVKVNGARHEG